MHSTKKWIGFVIVLQVAVLFGVWGIGPVASSVRADGIPDAGAQREQLIEQQKATNEKLDKILAILSGGDLKVKMLKSDDANK